MEPTRQVLLIDDDESFARLLRAGLSKSGYTVTAFPRAAEGLAALQERDFDAVITDLMMPGMDGIQVCERVVASRPGVPVLVVTAYASVEKAIAAIRAGAYDFITKPLQIAVAAMRLDRAVQQRALREQVKRLEREVASRGFDELAGDSPDMRRVRDLLERLERSDATVIISGESGTGKEVVARLLHNRGRRSGGPFAAINCAALPEPLLESELFGHVRGAFTGAAEDRAGLFQEAHGGTLFLDEIADMPLSLQPKLLRAIEERATRPVGGSGALPFDVRLIAATHQDIETALERGRLREDLYHRLNVVRVDLPPLSARGNDVLLLAQKFLGELAAQARKQVRGISAGAAEKLLGYRWPGNVRELKNCMERAVALARFEEINVDDLPDSVRDYHGPRPLALAYEPGDLVSLDQVERRYIERVLREVQGNKVVASRILEIDRRTLYRKLERYGLLDEPAPD